MLVLEKLTYLSANWYKLTDTYSNYMQLDFVNKHIQILNKRIKF